jgi:hypothetical protein
MEKLSEASMYFVFGSRSVLGNTLDLVNLFELLPRSVFENKAMLVNSTVDSRVRLSENVSLVVKKGV